MGMPCLLQLEHKWSLTVLLHNQCIRNTLQSDRSQTTWRGILKILYVTEKDQTEKPKSF